MTRYYIVFKGTHNTWHRSAANSNEANEPGFNTMNELFQYIHSPDFMFNKGWEYGIQKSEETKVEII